MKSAFRQFCNINWKNDIISGIIVALVSIPISMGYAQIAGLPVVYGLYGSLLPVLLYGLLTSSPQFVMGVDATPAALVGGSLATIGIAAGSEESANLVPIITLVSALWLLFFYFIKAGKIVNYISTPVMGGFISGIGVTIILMQISKLFGGNAGTGELFTLLIHIFHELENFNLLSAVLGFSTVVIVLVFKKLSPKFPVSVVLMVLGALASFLFHIEDYGVKLLPQVEAGLPNFVVLDFDVLLSDVEVFKEVIVLGLSVALVIMAQTLLATNNYANKYGYKVDNNREVLAYSVANTASAVFGGCPINGSVSRTGIADQLGTKSQVMSVTAALTMLIVVLFATPILSYLPVPILTGIVIAALIGIVEHKLAYKLWKSDHTEFFIFMAAFMGVLLLGTIYGVVIGVFLSFVAVLIRAVVPPKTFLGVIPEHEGFYSLTRYRKARPIKDTVIYRFSGSLFFANINSFQQDIENAINEDTKRVIVDAGAIGAIDITAADRLIAFNRQLKQKGIRFYITEHGYSVNDQLRELGASSLVEEGVTRRTISLALRDAGVDKPYPVEACDSTDYSLMDSIIESNEQLAEIEWAFGKDADIWLDKMAEEMQASIVADLNASTADSDAVDDYIIDAETHASWGRIGLFDEDELLEKLEIRFAEAKQKGIDIDEIEARIEKRRMDVEEKLAKINPDALHLLEEHRRDMINRFKMRNPEAYKHIVSHRKEHIRKLEKKDPELAMRMKKLYKMEEADNLKAGDGEDNYLPYER